MFQQGLKGVVAVQTAIASVDGDRGELRYRGQLVPDLIQGRSFEETAYFLWHGHWPDAAQLTNLQQQLIDCRKLPAHIAGITSRSYCQKKHP
ncbi:citrate/2-methylcitrate synthase [Planococcus sp. ISL-110]|uniref:citrate/2-methylcitrate synthase n=1 Tax=Planococcus sp. ISL-110 TaxID=2819167 RepID=UPI002035B3DF|nr:citrate/2-methylcitrate synthase [Planococcus sp. ISL-110]